MNLQAYVILRQKKATLNRSRSSTLGTHAVVTLLFLGKKQSRPISMSVALSGTGVRCALRWFIAFNPEQRRAPKIKIYCSMPRPAVVENSERD